MEGVRKKGGGDSVVLYHTQYVCMCAYAPCQGSSPYYIEMGWDETVTFWSRDTEPITPSS